MTRYIDLHTHSLASDGSDSPEQLAGKAAAAGLAAFALTDHDTVAGLAKAQKAAAELGIEFVPGVEIAVRYDFDELHLVALWVNAASCALTAHLGALRAGRDERNSVILNKLSELGLPLQMEEVRALAGGEAVGRPHIALAMKRKGYVYSRQDAFERYLGWGAKAYVPRALPTPEQGIRLLAESGATVVLAHPCLVPGMNRQRLNVLLGDLKDMGLSAVEVWHSSHDPNQTRLCRELAKRHNLLPSGGSDYHGVNKQSISIGAGQGNLRIPYSVLDDLRAYRSALGLACA